MQAVLARVLDAVSDYSAMLTHELEFRLPIRPPLRLAALINTPQPTRSCNVPPRFSSKMMR